MYFSLLLLAMTGLVAAASNCTALPRGAGPVPDPDTASAFKSFPEFAEEATLAGTPDFYDPNFTNLQAASSALGYLGYSNVRTYNITNCAERCNSKKDCVSFNIYFERAPTVDPGKGNSSCANPPSTTLIKCAFFSSALDASTAVNRGQFRNKFQVVIAGSNAYTKASIPKEPASGNLLVNGNFASGSLAPWTISWKSAESSISIANGVMNQIYYNSGSPATGADPYAYVYVQQPIALAVGRNYTIDFDYRFDNNDGVYQICRVRYPDGSNFQVIDQQIPQMPQGDAQYVHWSSSFVAAASTASFHIGAVDVFYMDSAAHYTNFVIQRSAVQNGST